MDPMTLPCADCGLLTGRFCDGGELDRTDHRIQVPGGQPCLAVHRVCEADGRHGELVALGHSDRVVPVDQRTPLCSTCCWASQVTSIRLSGCVNISSFSSQLSLRNRVPGRPTHCVLNFYLARTGHYDS